MGILWPIVGMEYFGTDSNLLPAVPTSALCVPDWLHFPSWGRSIVGIFHLYSIDLPRWLPNCYWGNISDISVIISLPFIMILSDNGFLSCNIDFKVVLVTFSSFSSWKRGDLLFCQWIVIFPSFYRVILWVLQETTNSSKLGLFEGSLAQLCRFLGGWEGVSLPV